MIHRAGSSYTLFTFPFARPCTTTCLRQAHHLQICSMRSNNKKRAAEISAARWS